jgi:ABC-type phosphate/phosphonate transport system substrate-binding protein/rhodanese-related sulfurtransferase
MKSFIGKTVFGVTIAALALPVAAQLKLSVSGEPREEISTALFFERYSELGNYIGATAGMKVSASFATDLSRELARTRSAGYDIVVGPAHIIGTAIRYGYEPVARFNSDERAVFIASEASGVTTLEQAAGKRLALPPADSLATYLARGEMNGRGLNLKSYFGPIRTFRYHEAALIALEFGQADVAVADSALAEAWLKRHKGHILLETRSAPGVGVAVLAKLGVNAKQHVRDAFLHPDAKLSREVRAAGFDVGRMRPIARDDYEYVSTLGYHTPRTLPGATIVTAAEVSELMRKGVSIYDTRVKEEYVDGHIKGALSLPYGEKSAKEADFDSSKDHFNVVGLPADKNAPIILSCNGPECWKSYKSSVAAIKAGYRQIYWFRGGFPEWRLKGYPVEVGAAATTAKAD